MAKRKRRITVIKKNLQFSTVISFIILGGIIATLIFALTRIFFSSMEEGELTPSKAASTHAMVFFLSLIIVAVAAYVFGLWTSHKVAGPLYRLEIALRKMERGDLTGRIFLRKGDLIHDTCEIFNRAMESMIVRAKGIREDTKALGKLLARISKDVDQPDFQKAQNLITNIETVFALTEEEAEKIPRVIDQT